MNDSAIAIIGMSCRFPGADSVERFWRNLCAGVESVSFFSDEELLAAGVDPTFLTDPNYIKAGTILPGVDLFDAAFFGFTPREAETMDPQQRLFLECAQEALENAGYHADAYAGAIGVFAGAGISSYLLYHLQPNRALVRAIGDYQLVLGNDKDFLPTRVSYKLNLKGPSVTVQTACSTSLVAVHLACQSLLEGECDMALAGGVSIPNLQKTGYWYQEDMIFSPDGHCRAFDAKAQGIVGGCGLGIVVLKRLEEALVDGDTIRAVIKGSAINNDGALKVGYTAPSGEGQAKVIREAQAIAGIEPETITYVETHGTATALGDPIEIAALTQAFQNGRADFAFPNPPWCAIGSVKTNIGHADAAAGVASLIKTVLALKHRQIPPSLHFEMPNPKIDFANSPFYVNAELSEWKADGTPRRAGVSSFGIGGTNAHVVLEEAPAVESSSPSRPWQLLLLSAKTPSALDTATTDLANHLAQHPELLNLADVAYTLQVGRQRHPHRRMLICQGIDDAVNALRAPERLSTQFSGSTERPVVFMFSGQGSQYVGMARELYELEPTFREAVASCAALLEPHLGLDIRQLLYPDQAQVDEAARQLKQTAFTQPALFVIEYALARLWQSWGIEPHALIGHSIGEYVAACLASVFSLKDALALIALRGRLMQALPAGAMLAVLLPEQALVLPADISLAAVNGPSHCVVSGPLAAIDALRRQLAERGVECRALHTSHAFHSAMMEPVMMAFTTYVGAIHLQAPQIPYVSNVTGTWITAAEATDTAYWARHLRQTVRFAQGLDELLKEPELILLEMGPGHTLSTFVRQYPGKIRQVVLPSIRHPHEAQSDLAFLLKTVGRFWLAGGQADWADFYADERRQRVPLPTYPFERQRYWIDPPRHGVAEQDVRTAEPIKKPEIADWFYVPSWERTLSPLPGAYSEHVCWLLFIDDCGLGEQLAKQLRAEGQAVTVVSVGTRFAKVYDGVYTLHPQRKEQYDALLHELRTQGKHPHTIVHLWSVDTAAAGATLEATEEALHRGFYSLLFLAQALGATTEESRLFVVTDNMQAVSGDETLRPEKATVLGPVKVIPQEFPNLSCRSIDVVLGNAPGSSSRLVDQLLAEMNPRAHGRVDAPSQVIAYRGRYRWEQIFKLLHLDRIRPSRVRQGGVYLITGGLGGIGLALAGSLAAAQARLILIGRSAVPERAAWVDWLATHPENDETSRRLRKIQTLEAAGAEVLVLRADVADYPQMQAAVARGLARFGRINGVIHAAGVPGDGVILRKTPAQAASVLAPKVRGTLVLDAVLQDVELDFMVLCSSLGSILGGFGQVDYTAANAFLDAFAQHAGNGFTVSINWDAWQEVGMSVAAKRTTNTQAVRHPLFDQRLSEDPAQATYVTCLHPDKDWVVNEHRVMGRATLPGIAYLEMARAAFENHARSSSFDMQDVYLLHPLTVEENEEKDVHTLLNQQGDAYEFSIISRNNSDEWQEHARGIIATLPSADGEQSPARYDLEKIKARCRQPEILRTPDEQAYFITFGPRWNRLSGQIWWGENEGLACLELPEELAEDLRSYPLHPALLDMATGFFLARTEGAYLPFSYKRLRGNMPLPRRLYSHSRYLQNSRHEILQCDVVLLDEQGNVLVEIEGYTVVRVEIDQGGAAAKPSAFVTPASALGRPVHDDPIQANLLKYGMSPSEGVDVFQCILASTEAQVLVSTRDLVERRREFTSAHLTSLLEQNRPEKQTYQRPELDKPYVAPRTETEQILVGIYQDLLGIGQVGIDDDFWELGGHSLLATQVIARLRNAFDLALPLQALFEEPTVAGLTAYIETLQAQGRQPENASDDELEEGVL